MDRAGGAYITMEYPIVVNEGYEGVKSGNQEPGNSGKSDLEIERSFR